MDAAISVSGLTKQYGSRTAFRDLTFEVGMGEVFGFLGPNGAGKTTTVRVLGTLIRPSSGTAVVAGVPVTEENGPELRSRIAVMPESPGLYLRLTVYDNLEYFAGLYGVARPETKRRIMDALDTVGMAARAGDSAGGLSKGLRQRAGLARTLLSDPRVLFLDEPTSGLDPVATREVRELIEGLRTRGVTVFLTTHRLEEAERLCDRIAIINTTLRVIGRPNDLRTELFESAHRGADRAVPGRSRSRPRRRRRRGVLERGGAGRVPRDGARPDVGDTGPHPRAGGRRRRCAPDRGGGTLAGGRLPPAGAGRRGGAAMNPRVRAVFRKELRDLRRNKFVVGSMVALPLIFVLLPILSVLGLKAGTTRAAMRSTVGGASLTFFLVPLILPTIIAGYGVIGEREQATLEPVLTTPVRESELLIGKALAAAVPTVSIAYAMFAVYVWLVWAIALPAVASLVLEPSQFVAVALFVPLLSLFSIWVGLAFSARSSDVRVAQQLSGLAVLPMVGVLALFSFRVISPSLTVAIVGVLALLLADALAWRVVSAMFDRERILTRYGKS